MPYLWFRHQKKLKKTNGTLFARINSVEEKEEDALKDYARSDLIIENEDGLKISLPQGTAIDQIKEGLSNLTKNPQEKTALFNLTQEILSASANTFNQRYLSNKKNVLLSSEPRNIRFIKKKGKPLTIQVTTDGKLINSPTESAVSIKPSDNPHIVFETKIEIIPKASAFTFKESTYTVHHQDIKEIIPEFKTHYSFFERIFLGKKIASGYQEVSTKSSNKELTRPVSVDQSPKPSCGSFLSFFLPRKKPKPEADIALILSQIRNCFGWFGNVNKNSLLKLAFEISKKYKNDMNVIWRKMVPSEIKKLQREINYLKALTITYKNQMFINIQNFDAFSPQFHKKTGSNITKTDLENTQIKAKTLEKILLDLDMSLSSLIPINERAEFSFEKPKSIATTDWSLIDSFVNSNNLLDNSLQLQKQPEQIHAAANLQGVSL